MELDTLEIKVISDTKDATNGLERLATTLQNIKNAIKAGNSTTLQRNIDAITSSVSQIQSGSILKLKYLAQGLQTLGTVRISKTIEERVFNIAAAVDLLKDVDMTKLTELSNGLQTFSTVGGMRTPGASSGSATTIDTSGSLSGTESHAAQAIQDTSEILNQNQGAWTSYSQTATSAMSSVSAATKSTYGQVAVLAKGAKIAFKGIANAAKYTFGAPFLLAKQAVTKLTAKFSELFRMFKKRVMYRFLNSIISAITQGFKEGTSNLYQYSKAINGPFAESMDRIATALLYFKNSLGAAVGPLINMLAPAIEYCTDKAVEFLNTINQLFARLSGASSWTKAIRYPKEYAEAAEDATKANEELKKTILGFDQLNVLQDNTSNSNKKEKTSDDYSKMFEEVALTASKNPLADFFDPFKRAWENEGANTIAAIKKAFKQIKDALDTVKNTFSEVWNNGSGQEALESSLRIIQNIVGTVGNLAEAFKKAWEENDNGLRITQSIFDIANSILDVWEDITGATKDWAADLDLSPLFRSIAGLLEQIKPLIDVIGTALTNLWKDIVLPFSKWLIEDVLPEVINIISAVTRAVTNFLDPIIDGLKKFWDEIQPIVDWFKGTVVEVLKKIEEYYSKIADKIEEKGPQIEGIISDIGNIIMKVWEVLEPFANWIKNDLLAAIDLFGNYVSTNFGMAIDALSGFLMFLSGVFTGDWEKAWQGIVTIFTGIWDGVKTNWENTGNYLETKIDNFVDFVEEAFGPLIDWLSEKWEKFKGTVSEVWEGIKTAASDCWDGIVDFFSPAIDWFSDLFGSIRKIVKDVFYNIGVIASVCWQVIKKVFAPVVQWFRTNIIQPLTNAFTNVWQWFSNKASEAWEAVKRVFSEVGRFFRETFEKAWQGIVKVFSVGGEIFVNIKDGVLSAFKWVVNKLINGINNVVAVPFNGINGVLKWLRDISIAGLKPFSGIQEINIPQIPQLAQGGTVPNNGSMFIAGEAGAEVVANLGNRTGVMNVDQMQRAVEQGIVNATGSIANAVAAAVAKAGQNGIAPTVEVTVKADSETLYKTVKKGEKYYNNRYHVVAGV